MTYTIDYAIISGKWGDIMSYETDVMRSLTLALRENNKNIEVLKYLSLELRRANELKEIEHSNPLEEDDIKSALETYDRQYYNFTIDDIVKLTDIPIEKNKRNYRKQDQHLKLARGQLELLKEMGEVEVGRPSKESLVREYLEDNPDHSPTEIARNLGISRTTVYKYIN